MDDVPLATRLKKRRVEKTGKKSRHAEEINHSEEINLGLSMRRAGSQLVGKSQSLPVKWQVQRLITVMSVATTGRATLLVNRQLKVGVHLTIEEAAILEDYGWNPSSGLGSLLNFCERVVYDYNKGQRDLGNDWKQKIGKLLMDGYDHGSIVQSIPRKLQRVLGDNLSNTDSFQDHFCLLPKMARFLFNPSMVLFFFSMPYEL